MNRPPSHGSNRTTPGCFPAIRNFGPDRHQRSVSFVKMAKAVAETMVTPESVAAMVNSGRPKGLDGSQSAAPDPGASDAPSPQPRVERRRHYASLHVFDVDMHDAETGNPLLTLEFHRDRGFGWKLAAVRFPERPKSPPG